MKALIATFFISCTTLVITSLQAQDSSGQPVAPLVALVMGKEIHTADSEEMKYLILDRLLNRYATEQDIEVSQMDIDAYIDAMARVVEQDRRQRAAQREELVRQLDAAPPGDARRDALTAEIKTLDQLQSSLDKMASNSGEDRGAREEVATAFIRQWKINRALYRQYGGRIIYQQGGPEPLDAYRAFLEDREKDGAFRILDKSLESEFWRYYTTESIHTFYPAGSHEEKQVFETPWWLSENPQQ